MKPALTAEEWAKRRVLGLSRHDDPRIWVEVRGGALLVLNDDDPFYDASIGPDKSPGVMALCNSILPDDDPRRITREDVETLVTIAGDPSRYYGPASAYTSQVLRAIAAKLAALLPPETA